MSQDIPVRKDKVTGERATAKTGAHSLFYGFSWKEMLFYAILILGIVGFALVSIAAIWRLGP